ncbi:diguanylate cyclase [Sphingopyxis sp. H038]|uniref:GGDEF domain-containing protein n=1 Tax=unclassified Sphingopyxis TaxID=2614943 RepID=UPI0007310132|nr:MULTISPECIES: GGDEF domain-containing protein [unclassified Sphingopyxis]KTE03732.1 diguanylate cyclase [Sphingopyxis sp. H012]KTE09190.1 diguanylate cyclase [Sphingopyxis sp. H053]KTE14841.1 diguanylate cyclase [Sphingopyxis sp. H093]KTE29228.1 diguanylate cyclase [Sphingopyxis sp. H080]KTE35060.1 diguanylate cyclase [Sphingopyxis sp. H038]
MIAAAHLLAHLCGRLGLGFAVLVLAMWAAPAAAGTLDVDRDLCHAQTGVAGRDSSLPTLRFSCSGSPADYQQGSLWLRAPLEGPGARRGDVTLMVHQSRFDRLAVAFSYADGTTRWQQVRAGDYGSHWRTGGQILFEAPDGGAALTAVTMRFDRLSGHQFIHARLIPKAEAAMQSAGMAAAIGAALTLLLISCIYSLSLAFAVRRQYLAWQAAWSGTMLLWGALWSQIHLALVPGLAGTVTTQICTFLSCLAIALATVSAATAVDRGRVPKWLRAGTLILGVGVGLAGIPLALIRGSSLGLLGDALGLVVLADLAAVTVYLGWAWRRGSVEARDFLAAWGLPMAVLAAIHVVDVEDGFWGGGSKLLVLVAATWQALWLAAAATRRLGHLRIERDHARSAAAQAQQLARRDPLTGLPNRRGFVESVTPLLERARADNLPAALLLVDIDRFKSINDIYGHDAGDVVLCGIARRIERWEGPMCTVARLGGEEFGLLTIGMEGIILGRFAESIRRGIAACDHSATVGERLVTASVGVAEVRPACDFQQLYRLADEALYDAKRGGRNKVVVQRHYDMPGRASAREVARTN